ncbi:MAG: hypothetical protein ACJ8R9_10945 [Steroidobacteraceae bacterium]
MAGQDSTEQSRRMAGPDGKMYDIPYSQVESAHKDGLEFTTNMIDPKDNNKTYSIPNSQMDQARKDGLDDMNAPPTMTTPYEQKLHDQDLQASQDAKGVLGRAKDSFTHEFLMGGATDIRNMTDAVAPMAGEVEGLGQLFGRGATGAAKTWDAVTKTRIGAKTLQQDTGLVDRFGAPITKEVTEGGKTLANAAWDSSKAAAGATGRGVVSLGKWLGRKAINIGTYGAGGYALGKGIKEVKDNASD